MMGGGGEGKGWRRYTVIRVKLTSSSHTNSTQDRVKMRGGVTVQDVCANVGAVG